MKRKHVGVEPPATAGGASGASGAVDGEKSRKKAKKPKAKQKVGSNKAI